MHEDVTEKENGEMPLAPLTQDDAGGEGSGGKGGSRKSGDTKVGLTLRILVSAYVLYLAYGLIQGFGDAAGNDRIFIAIAIVVFVAAGGGILLISAKKLIKKEYTDAEENEETEDGEK